MHCIPLGLAHVLLGLRINRHVIQFRLVVRKYIYSGIRYSNHYLAHLTPIDAISQSDSSETQNNMRYNLLH